MQNLPVLTDPVFVPREHYNAFDRFLLSLIRDERDLPFVHLTIRITVFMMSLGLALYIPGLPIWLFAIMAIGYTLMNNFLFKGLLDLLFI